MINFMKKVLPWSHATGRAGSATNIAADILAEGQAAIEAGS